MMAGRRPILSEAQPHTGNTRIRKRLPSSAASKAYPGAYPKEFWATELMVTDQM